MPTQDSNDDGNLDKILAELEKETSEESDSPKDKKSKPDKIEWETNTTETPDDEW